MPPSGDARLPVVETHLLNHDGALYGRQVRLGFVQRMRDERAFESADALRAQIRVDIERVGELFDRMSL